MKKNKKPDNYEEQLVIRYLEHHLPASASDPDVRYVTTQDLQDMFAPMAEIELNRIAAILFDCGYEIGTAPDGRPAWMMT